MKSEQIQQHIVRFFQAARTNRMTRLTLRAGSIHRELELHQRLPQVCGVLGSFKLQREARVALVGRGGPQPGGNATFTFLLWEVAPAGQEGL